MDLLHARVSSSLTEAAPAYLHFAGKATSVLACGGPSAVRQALALADAPFVEALAQVVAALVKAS